MCRKIALKCVAGVIVGIVVIVCSFCLFVNDEESQDLKESSYLQGWKIAMAARSYISNDNLRYDES